eukprot:41372-Eustigmatos_ZCMA.PRE.1
MDFVNVEGDLKEPRSVRRQKGVVVKAGDLVIIMERHDQLSSIYATPGTVLQNRFGAFRHDDIIGKPFGSKVRSVPDPVPLVMCMRPRLARHS